MKDYLSTSQVAEILGVSGEKARLMVVARTFPNAFKLGNGTGRNEWRVPRADLDAFITARSRAALIV